MKIEDTHTYDASVEDVLEMFGDPDAVVARYEGMGHRDIEVLECKRLKKSLVVRTRRVVDVELPGFAKKVLKPTNTMEQTDSWTPGADGSWDGTFEVEVDSPVELSGTMRLEPLGGQSKMTLAITMNVKVPLVGGKIADWAGKNDVRTTMDAEFAAGDAWIAGHKS